MAKTVKFKMLGQPGTFNIPIAGGLAEILAPPKPALSRADRKRMRELTMGCWWPSSHFPKRTPNWVAIGDELSALADDELDLRANQAGANEASRLAALAFKQAYQ